MPRGSGRPDTRDKRESRERDRSDRGIGSLSAAQRAGQTRAFEKSKRESQKSDRSSGPYETSLNAAIQEMAAREGFVNDVFGINHSIDVNPETNDFDVRTSKEFSPLGALAGIFGGPIGSAVAFGADALGFEDPFAFSIDLGFGDAEAQTVAEDDQRSDDPASAVKTPAAEKVQTAASAEENTSIDRIMAQLLEDFEFEMFEMPEFELLNADFGKEPTNERLAALFDTIGPQVKTNKG